MAHNIYYVYLTASQVLEEYKERVKSQVINTPEIGNTEIERFLYENRDRDCYILLGSTRSSTLYGHPLVRFLAGGNMNHRYFKTNVTLEVLTHDTARNSLMKSLKVLVNECGPGRLVKVKHKRVKVEDYIEACRTCGE